MMSALTPISYRMAVYGPSGTQTILFCDEPKPWTLEAARNSAKAHVANVPGVDGCTLYGPDMKEIAGFTRGPAGGVTEEEIASR
jgi:hypothetical protein